MIEFNITIHWITFLIIGFITGSAFSLFALLAFTAVVEKKCTCKAWNK